MRDALLLVDVLNDFEHEDGDVLLASFRERQPALVAALSRAREREIPVIYANDNFGVWDGDARAQVERARAGKGGELVAGIVPQEGDRFVVKPRYSAFDHTPLELILRELEIERILLAGMATEMCVAQTAIAAREEGFKVTVLANACAAVDPELEQLALRYLERVGGVFVE
jgi:nicotinamidase-related amidase